MVFLIIASIFRFELHSLYVHHYVFNKVNVLQIPSFDQRTGRASLSNFCSASQVTYEGRQFTLTNLHCCAVADRSVPGILLNHIGRQAFEGKSLIVDGHRRKILYASENHDLCLLEPIYAQKSFKLAPFWYTQQPVSVIGHPRGLPRMIRSGHIVVKDKSIFPWLTIFQPKDFIMLSTTTYPGNSGSPVVDLFGNLVGVIFAGFKKFHTEGLMVPLEDIREFLASYVKANK